MLGVDLESRSVGYSRRNGVPVDFLMKNGILDWTWWAVLKNLLVRAAKRGTF